MIVHNVGKTSQPVGDNNAANVGNNMVKTMMGAPLFQTMLGHNNMDKNIRYNMFGLPMMGHKTYSNMMGRDLASNMVGQDMPSHMMDRSMMGSQDMYTNANLMAPVNMMSQKMQIETMPSQSFTRFF